MRNLMVAVGVLLTTILFVVATVRAYIDHNMVFHAVSMVITMLVIFGLLWWVWCLSRADLDGPVSTIENADEEEDE